MLWNDGVCPALRPQSLSVWDISVLSDSTILSADSVFTNWVYDVFMAVAVNNTVVWDATPCSLVEIYQPFF
jgi:hypothetical protein